MMRRTFLSTLGAMIAFVAMFVANSGHAAAQQDPYCCNYVIDVAGIPAACFPLVVTTVWGGSTTKAYVVTANGISVDGVPNCPPFPALPFTAVAVTSSGGCTVAVAWANACCIRIVIR